MGETNKMKDEEHLVRFLMCAAYLDMISHHLSSYTTDLDLIKRIDKFGEDMRDVVNRAKDAVFKGKEEEMLGLATELDFLTTRFNMLSDEVNFDIDKRNIQ